MSKNPAWLGLNNSLHSLVKYLGENDFSHLSHEFNANVLDLLKKSFFHMIPCLPKISLIIHWLIKLFLIKLMNMFLTSGNLLK